MIDVNQSDLTVCILELVVLAIGGDINICPLFDRLLDELCAIRRKEQPSRSSHSSGAYNARRYIVMFRAHMQGSRSRT